MYRGAWILAALVLLAAGCIGADETDDVEDPTEEDDAPDERPELVPPSFASPVPVATTNAAEPGMVAGEDGTLYVLDFTHLYQSTDGGQTYTSVEAPFEDGGDSDLVVGANGTLHYVGMGIDDEGPQLPYHRRLANGTWEPVRELASDSSSVDRQWLTQAGNGTLVLTWNDFEAGEHNLRLSHDGGDTWTTTRSMPGGFAPFAGPPAVHEATVLQAFKLQSEVSLVRSTDAGVTWERVEGPEIIGDTVGFPTLAFDEAGTLYVAAAHDTRSSSQQDDTTRPQIHVWRSPDAGETWSEFTRVGTGPITAPSGTTAIFPWIVAGAPGQVAVAFYENTLGTPPDRTTGEWYPAVSATTTGDREDPTWETVHLTDEPVKNGSICTGGTGCSTAGDWRFRDYFEMDLTSSGHPVVAFVRDTAPVSPARMPPGEAARVEVVATVGTDGWTAWPGSASP